MQFRPSLKQTAKFFGTSEDTISRAIKISENLSFIDFKNQYSANTKLRLMEKALEMAFGGNTTMMIFCLKNLCDWGDKPSSDDLIPTEGLIRIAYVPKSQRSKS